MASKYQLARWRTWYALQDFRNFLPLVTTIDEAAGIVRPWPKYDYLNVTANELQLTEGMLWIPKSRRIMATWTVTLYILWECLRSDVFLGIIQSQTDDHSKKILQDKLKVAWERLPYWFKWVVTDGRLDEIQFTKREMALHGNRTILCVPQGAHQSRQHTPSIVFIDEAAHQENFTQSLTAIIPFLEKKTKILLVSSVAGGSMFTDVLMNTAPLETPQLIYPGNTDLPAERRKGIQKWTLSSGGQVLQLHYSAHPERDAKWLEHMAATIPGGLESAMFRQEFEIEYDAFSGALVFDNFSLTEHVKEFEIDERVPLTQYLAADYGVRNPTAVLRVVRLGETLDGPRYGVFREYYQTKTSIKDLKAQIWQIFGPPENYEIELIDPSTDAVREEDTETHLYMFNSGGYARKFQKADRSNAGITFIKELLHQGRLVIHPSCTNLINEITQLRHQRWASDKTAEQHNPKEKIVDKDNHGVDALKYLANYLSYRENPREDDNEDRKRVLRTWEQSRPRMAHGIMEETGWESYW